MIDFKITRAFSIKMTLYDPNHGSARLVYLWDDPHYTVSTIDCNKGSKNIKRR